jgi:hypothetical protein
MWHAQQQLSYYLSYMGREYQIDIQCSVPLVTAYSTSLQDESWCTQRNAESQIKPFWYNFCDSPSARKLETKQQIKTNPHRGNDLRSVSYHVSASVGRISIMGPGVTAMHMLFGMLTCTGSTCRSKIICHWIPLTSWTVMQCPLRAWRYHSSSLDSGDWTWPSMAQT